jgi:putative ABC transport system substrate-binding protein
VSYGPNVAALYHRAADYVDKMLRAANPSELPVEQPTEFDFVINLKTANTLGLAEPPILLATANEVSE